MLSLSLDSPLYTIKNPRSRRNILAAFVIGFLFGHVSLVLGAIFALEGTKALIQIVLHRSAWIRFLKVDVPRMFRKAQQGRIRSWNVHANQLTREPDRYFVSLEHCIAARNSHDNTPKKTAERTIDTQDGSYSLDVVRYFIQQLREVEMELKTVDDDEDVGPKSNGFLYLTRDPDIGFPLHYIENKRQEQLFWAQYVEIGIAFLGIQIFFLAAFIYANLSAQADGDVWIVMLQAILSPILMSPYLVLQSTVRHQQRMQAWKDDPLTAITEFESLSKYWHWLGSTMMRKIYSVVFLLGASILFLCCGSLALVLGLGTIYCVAEWVDVEAPIQRETLQSFQSQAKPVSATVDKFWVEPSRSFLFGSKKYFVQISYVAPSGHTVSKDIESKLLYEDCTQHDKKDIQVFVHPTYPRSGYPCIQFFWDWHRSWPLWCWHVASIVTLWLYLITSCVVMDVDLDYPPDELIFPVTLIFVCPMLLLPHASVWRRKAYHRYWQRLHETGTILEESGGATKLGQDDASTAADYNECSYTIRSNGDGGDSSSSNSSGSSSFDESW